jgi:hypothetical protein
LVVDAYAYAPGVLHVLWAANRLLSPKVRVFVDHMTAMPR